MSDKIAPEVLLALYEKADDEVGVYPLSSVDEKGIETPRTERQEGWNDAIMAIQRNKDMFTFWYNHLPVDIKGFVGDLLIDDVIQLFVKDDDTIEMWVNLNDTFYYAAYGEGILPTEIHAVFKIYKLYGWDGIVAWFAIKLDKTPIKGHDKSEKYKQALAELK